MSVSVVGSVDFEQVEPRPAHEHEAEIPDELLVMLLADPEEVHDLAVEIVQDLDLRRLLAEEHLRAARECLDVRRVLRETGR